jgi:hypothetical protein
MANVHRIIVAVMWLVPSAALAHGSGGHPADPDLHVDASLEDCSVQFAPELGQGAFGRFAREFGSVAAFKQMSPPTTLGQWGFAIGLEQIWFSVEERSDAWNDTFAHPDSYHELGSDLAFPKLRARVGITDDLDLGVFYTEQPNANYGWIGLEAKYGLLQQSAEMPISLALRGAYTKTLYVDDMDMHSISTDVSAGRTFWGVLTPYLGLGSDLVLVRETSDAVNLESEAQLVPHALGGLEVRFWHVALGTEVHLAALTSVQVQLSAVF